MANLVIGLFEHGGITTTEAMPKALRPFAEKLMTKGKQGGVHRQRQVVAFIRDQDDGLEALRRHRPPLSGPPRRLHPDLKLGPRPGDEAPMARIELV